MGSNCLGTIGNRCNGQHPVIRDRERIISTRCERPRGGTKTVGIPQYKMVVTNLTEQPEDIR